MIAAKSAELRRKVEFAQWVAPVNEELAAGNENSSEPPERLGAGFRESAIQRSDAHSERQVVGSLAGLQREIFDCNLTDAEPSFGDEPTGRKDNLLDRLC
jgi:hypothetical protein